MNLEARFIGRLSVLALFCATLPGWAISVIRQPSVPEDLSRFEGAILEENDVFFTIMTERAVRSLSKDDAEVVERDEKGDSDFIRDHRNSNGDYWYWAHQKAREALILALGREPEEAVKTIDTIPYTEAIIPEYRWITSPEFREYLATAKEDLAYYYNSYLGVNVFLTNYQVSRLEREYPNSKVAFGPERGKPIRAQIPMLEIDLQELIQTPRKGEEETVGLNAILHVEPDGITDSLLPSSEEYREREPRLQERLITAGSDWNFKQIPVSSRSVREMFEPLMSANQRFLEIRGSMRADSEATVFTEDMMVIVNPDAPLAAILMQHRAALGKAEIKRAE
jgi:hypothetical protein